MAKEETTSRFVNFIHRPQGIISNHAQRLDKNMWEKNILSSPRGGVILDPLGKAAVHIFSTRLD